MDLISVLSRTKKGVDALVALCFYTEVAQKNKKNKKNKKNTKNKAKKSKQKKQTKKQTKKQKKAVYGAFQGPRRIGKNTAKEGREKDILYLFFFIVLLQVKVIGQTSHLGFLESQIALPWYTRM